MDKNLNEPNYLDMLISTKLNDKKNMMIRFSNNTITEINDITNKLSNITDINISNSVFVETAVKYFINNLKSSKFIKEPLLKDDQIIIFSSSSKNKYYEERFLGNNKNNLNYWIISRLGKNIIELINNNILKYISVCSGEPHKYCEKYGIINNVEKININNLNGDDISNIGKYRIIFNNISNLHSKVILQSQNTSIISAGKRCAFKKFLKSQYIEQL